MNSHRFASTEADMFDLGAMLSALWRGKLIILMAMCVAVLIGGYYAFKVAVPQYTSSGVVMLHNREQQVVDLQGVMGGLGSDATVVNTEVEVLRSRALIRSVVETLNLQEDPEFNGYLQPPGLKDQIFGMVRAALGVSKQEELVDTARDRIYMQATVDSFLQAFSVRNIPQSLVFTISMTTTSAEKSALIVDTLVDHYIQNQLDVKFEATEVASAWLSDRVAALQVELETAESKVSDFRSQTDLISPDVLSAIELQLQDTRSRIELLQEQANSSAERLSALEAATTIEEQVDAANDEQLRQLMMRVDQPSIRQAFDTRLQQVENRLRLDLQRSANQISALESSLTEMQSQVDRQSQDLITLQQLTREAEASRLLYEYLLGRLKETSAQQGIQQADSRSLSAAVIPNMPSAPRKSLILVASAILGMIIGSAIVVVYELRQNTFRSAEELTQATGLSVIGQIPLIKGRLRKDVLNYLATHPTSASAEAIRNLRTSLMLSNVDNPPQVIMMCSSLPAEGKTTVSFALTLNFSSLGKKVLLIEGDVRRNIFDRYLNHDSKGGLVEVLSGNLSLDDAIVSNDLLQADVLLAARTKTATADLFSSERFADLIKELRTRYDVILIDTPPVLAIPDARIISQNCDTIAFVVRWDDTTPAQLSAALKEFENVGRRVNGLVLNQVNPRGMRRYGYGGNYGAYSKYGAKYYSG